MTDYGIGFNGRIIISAESENDAESKIRKLLCMLDDIHIDYIVNMSEEEDDEQNLEMHDSKFSAYSTYISGTQLNEILK